MALFQKNNEDVIDDTTVLFCNIQTTENDKGYTAYVLRVQRGYGPSAPSWLVKHRYSDFDQLNDSLSKSRLPLPLPPKKLFGNLERDFIAQRIRALQDYLNCVLAHPLLSTSLPVKKFLYPQRYSKDGKTEALQLVSLSLRSFRDWSVHEYWQQPSWRLQKHYMTVENNTNERKRKALLAWNYYGPDWSGDVQATAQLLEYLRALQHPYICVPECASCTENGALVVRRLFPEGSLRDQMCKAKPSESVLKKYVSPKTVYPIDVEDIRFICRHILEALLFLHQVGIPYGQLHCGNLAITSSGCQLLDVETGFLGLPSFFRPFLVQHKAISSLEAVDVYCFGQTLYELAFGEPLNAPVMLDYPPGLPRILLPVLTRILSPEAVNSGLPTVKELLQDDLFAGLGGKEAPKESRIPAKVKTALERSASRILDRLKQEQREFKMALKTQKIAAFVNSEEQKKERRRIMKEECRLRLRPSASSASVSAPASEADSSH